ncbi:HNH endonuclease [Arthrobacter phage Hankly]|nr:HNH endonuclease [Arthrobacter phage Hankly]
MIEAIHIDYHNVEEIVDYIGEELEAVQGQFAMKRDVSDEVLYFVVESPRTTCYWRVLTKEELEAEYFFFQRERLRSVDGFNEVRRIDNPKVEWRRIPEFPNYKITRDGDVKNALTGHLLTEFYTEKGTYRYELRKNGKKCWRVWKKLAYSAWPELLEDWRELPGFPLHLVNRDGQIMGKRALNILVPGKFGTYPLKSADGTIKSFNPKKFDIAALFVETEEVAA